MVTDSNINVTFHLENGFTISTPWDGQPDHFPTEQDHMESPIVKITFVMKGGDVEHSLFIGNKYPHVNTIECKGLICPSYRALDENRQVNNLILDVSALKYMSPRALRTFKGEITVNYDPSSTEPPKLPADLEKTYLSRVVEPGKIVFQRFVYTPMWMTFVSDNGSSETIKCCSNQLSTLELHAFSDTCVTEIRIDATSNFSDPKLVDYSTILERWPRVHVLGFKGNVRPVGENKHVKFLVFDEVAFGHMAPNGLRDYKGAVTVTYNTFVMPRVPSPKFKSRVVEPGKIVFQRKETTLVSVTFVDNYGNTTKFAWDGKPESLRSAHPRPDTVTQIHFDGTSTVGLTNVFDYASDHFKHVHTLGFQNTRPSKGVLSKTKQLKNVVFDIDTLDGVKMDGLDELSLYEGEITVNYDPTSTDPPQLLNGRVYYQSRMVEPGKIVFQRFVATPIQTKPMEPVPAPTTVKLTISFPNGLEVIVEECLIDSVGTVVKQIIGE